MRPLREFTGNARGELRGIFTDIDDTITTEGRLTAAAYGALERLQQAGLLVIPITGRPAGWCDHIARFWPVDGIVGENGAFYFAYDRQERRFIRRFLQSESEREEGRRKLAVLRRQILAAVPGAGVASDQAYREADLAIDFCEDVPPLPPDSVEEIARLFREAGATAKISSIHVNGWFGDYDKLTMTKLLMRERFDLDIDSEKARFVFAGDSPNDAPMFGFFPHSVGMANVLAFADRLASKPAYVTEGHGGSGFVELADALLKARGSR